MTERPPYNGGYMPILTLAAIIVAAFVAHFWG